MNELPAPLYPLCDVAAITKRHVHDVRNALNGMELELTLLEGTAKDSEAREAVNRLRHAVSDLDRLMLRMSSKYAAETPSLVPVIQIVERWQSDAHYVASDVPLEWSIDISAVEVYVESGLIRTILADMLQTAASTKGRKRLHITCRVEAQKVFFEIALGEGTVTARRIDSQQTYWTALRRLAERNQGALEPEQLNANSFQLRLTVPVFDPSS